MTAPTTSRTIGIVILTHLRIRKADRLFRHRPKRQTDLRSPEQLLLRVQQREPQVQQRELQQVQEQRPERQLRWCHLAGYAKRG